jgi:hypothetical protein
MTDIIRIENIENYQQEIVDGSLILIPKKTNITEAELNTIGFENSSILSCSIKNEDETISTKVTYRSILIDIWKSMPTQKIFQNTTFNFKLSNENGLKGYNWSPEINMSFQNKDSKNTIKEIINMVKINKYNINICIRLESNKTIWFKI